MNSNIDLTQNAEIAISQLSKEEVAALDIDAYISTVRNQFQYDLDSMSEAQAEEAREEFEQEIEYLVKWLAERKAAAE